MTLVSAEKTIIIQSPVRWREEGGGLYRPFFGETPKRQDDNIYHLRGGGEAEPLRALKRESESVKATRKKWRFEKFLAEEKGSLREPLTRSRKGKGGGLHNWKKRTQRACLSSP